LNVGAGHGHASTTAISTSMSSDYNTRALRAARDRGDIHATAADEGGR
jgi:hypothetical protein